MKIKVASPSFCKSQVLRQELLQWFPQTEFNETLRILGTDELIDFLQGAEGALIGTEKVTRSVIEALPELKILAKYGVGLDNLDVAYAQSLHKVIGWRGGINRRSVAEQTLGFMLGLTRNLFSTGFSLKKGQWHKQGGWQLSGKTVGIVGCGFVGSEVLKLLQPFECPALVYDIADKTEELKPYRATQVSLETLLREADVVTLHVPLTASTFRLIHVETLGWMKPSAFLINTSRGAVVDQQALAQALRAGKLAGAALDVFTEEPPTELAFLELPNLMVTPHIGGNAREAVEAMGRAAIESLREFFLGYLPPEGTTLLKPML